MSRESEESYEFGKFRLDVGEHRLMRLDGPTTGSIPEKAFQTLTHLVRNSGTLITKNELLATVWRDSFVEENNLVKAIYAIRRFLDDMREDPKYIETVPKHGYRFIASVTRGEQGTTARSLSPPQAPERAPEGRSSARGLYLRGKVKAGTVKRDETEAAVKLLEQAVAIDPQFAEAFAQLARLYIRMAFNFSDDSDRERFLENAEVAIEAALDLEPDLAEGHFARGLLLWTHTKAFAHEQAIQSYKRSLRSNPDADETHHQLSMVYGHIGLLEEALRAVTKAIEINPNNTMARFRVSNYLVWQGRSEEALAALKTVPGDVSPLLVERIRAEALIQMGRLDDARAIVERYLKDQPSDVGGSFTSVRALLNALRGNAKAALYDISLCAEAGKGFGHYHHTAYNIGSAYAALNEPDNALTWLESAADDGFPCYPYFAIDRHLDRMRDNPKFTKWMSVQQSQWEHFKQIA